jgi:hypothetical protein
LEVVMADLTKLEDKLGEVIGLAMAAQGATEKVVELTDDDDLRLILERMNAEAAEAEKRGTKLAGSFEGKKTAISEKARETKSKATEMMSIYLDDDADALDGLEFLTMAEAGEVGHWKVLHQMGESAGQAEVMSFARWGVPIQERHLDDVEASCVKLASEEDPREPAD